MKEAFLRNGGRLFSFALHIHICRESFHGSKEMQSMLH